MSPQCTAVYNVTYVEYRIWTLTMGYKSPLWTKETLGFPVCVSVVVDAMAWLCITIRQAGLFFVHGVEVYAVWCGYAVSFLFIPISILSLILGRPTKVKPRVNLAIYVQLNNKKWILHVQLKEFITNCRMPCVKREIELMNT